MSEYQLTSTNAVVRNADLASVPNDSDNRDRAEYEKWLATGGVPDPYAPPPPSVPQTISDRQFFQQLAVSGIITQADALASNAAVIPPPLLKLIDAMPTDQQFAAKMLVGGATVFERRNPLTIAIGMGYGMAPDQIDAFFTAAALL